MTIQPVGAEFLVNVTTSPSDQSDPNVAALTNGRIVMAWTDFSATGGDTSGAAVKARIFAADGTPFSAEFLVNATTTPGSQTEPCITALTDGRFVVAWRDDSQTGGDISSSAIRARIFNADSSQSGPEFLVNTADVEPAVRAQHCRAGRRALRRDMDRSEPDRWRPLHRRGPGAGVQRRRDEIRRRISGQHHHSKRTVRPRDHHVERRAFRRGLGGLRSQTGGDISSTAIRAQVFNADGTKSGGEFLVNTTTFNNQVEPDITALAGGRFVVAWTDFSQTGGDTSHWSVRAQVFNADGTKSGGEFLVNTTTAGQQSTPNITGLADGRFVATWNDFSRTGGDIMAQVFNADGSKSGADFPVNTTTKGTQPPYIVAMDGGGFVVAWTDNSVTPGDMQGNAVRAQIFGDINTPPNIVSGGGPVAFYNFDDTSGGIARDQAGSHNGTIVGATSVPGRSGNALQFSGNSHVVVPDLAHWAFGSSDFSVVLWAKFAVLRPPGPKETPPAASWWHRTKAAAHRPNGGSRPITAISASTSTARRSARSSSRRRRSFQFPANST